MTTPLYALTGFVFWTILLVFGLGFVRVTAVLRREKQPNEFPLGTQDNADLHWRLNRAHLNCVENLPLFAAVVLIGALVGTTSTTLDNLARVFMVARICQSLVHIASVSNAAVTVRFTFYVIQLFCLAWFACLLVI